MKYRKINSTTKYLANNISTTRIFIVLLPLTLMGRPISWHVGRQLCLSKPFKFINPLYCIQQIQLLVTVSDRKESPNDESSSFFLNRFQLTLSNEKCLITPRISILATVKSMTEAFSVMYCQTNSINYSLTWNI